MIHGLESRLQIKIYSLTFDVTGESVSVLAIYFNEVRQAAAQLQVQLKNNSGMRSGQPSTYHYHGNLDNAMIPIPTWASSVEYLTL